jgi:hypothetical protein
MSMEHRWDDTDTGKLKYLEKTLLQYCFIYKSHIEYPDIEPSPPR